MELKATRIGVIICLIISFVWAKQTHALDSADLLFHLSFENGVNPELSRGSSSPIVIPQELQRRLVEGLFGKGYLFGGKGSTVTFYTGDKGGARANDEMYGSKANLFGDSGTVAFWIKPLPNSHNMSKIFFRSWPIDIHRNEYMHHGYNYGAKGGSIYDCPFTQNPWIFFALTWRKNEAKGYYNSNLMSSVTETGVVSPTPEQFMLACEGMSYLDFQKKDFEDDAVMDEFQIFRRPLTNEEIRSLFERGRVTTKQQIHHDPYGLVTKPERAYAGHALVAPVITTAIKADGDLSDWKEVPSHGGFIERRIGVLDNDDAKVSLACDAQNLYLGLFIPVDESIRKDPTHVWYPTGQFKAGMSGRDSDLYTDDYVEWVLKGKDGHEYRIAVNAKGAFLDSRDEDKNWNGEIEYLSRSDFEDWTAEIIIPLSQVGLSLGDTIDFNVIRSWKLFKSAQNSLCADERSQFGYGKLTLGGNAASVSGLGKPWQGRLEITGTITGSSGTYSVNVEGKGFGQQFEEKETVTVGNRPASFQIKRRLDKPGDMGLVVRVKDGEGKEILTRSIPFVYVSPVTVEIANYPGWGRVEVLVNPVDATGVKAVISIKGPGKRFLKEEIPEFEGEIGKVVFDTRNFPEGEYEVVTRLYREETLVGEDIQPYTKKPLPEWYDNKVGIIEVPPIPWTEVKVEGSTIRLLMKDIHFEKTLFPAQIISNSISLLASPIRVRVKRNGEEKVITAGDFKITKLTKRRVDWVSQTKDGELSITVNGWIEFDGFTWAVMTLSGEPVDHLSLEIPLRKESATLKTLEGAGLMGDKPLQTINPSYWFGNEKAGLQYWWDNQQGWVLNNEKVQITPTEKEVLISIPFIQKTAYLDEPRTVAFGWAITPSKPVRQDWRHISLYKGTNYFSGDYTWLTPNYPKPRDTKEQYQDLADRLKNPGSEILLWYAFGPFMWVGSPEYAEWWREWRSIPSSVARPDPNATAWGPACSNSSASNLFIWMLDRFVKEYPQRGIYFDCMHWSTCKNEAHDCGYIDDDGVKRETSNLLSSRRHYERAYNIFKSADPVYGWVRHHDWYPNMAWAPFSDENWWGEGHIGPIGGTPEKNYYRIVDLPYARTIFNKEQWGHLTSWLTELACSAGDDKEKRAEWYGKMVNPPKDGKPGEWVLPRWKDYEHVAGLGLIHDMGQISGNDLQLPWLWTTEMHRMMRWDDRVRFVGYWELGDLLEVTGGIPEKVVCSVYYRPAGTDKPNVLDIDSIPKPYWRNFTVADDVKSFLRTVGESEKGWLILVPMNNTDEDVTITLKPNLKKLGFERLASGRLRDIYRAFDFTWQGPPGWIANAGDPEPPHITIKNKEEAFFVVNGTSSVTIPRRNFRMLLMEPGQ